MHISRNAIFIGAGEFGFSVNYDRIILKKFNNKLSLRVGTDPFFISRGKLQHGAEIQYLYGRTHHVGIALGFVYGSGQREPLQLSDVYKYAALFACGKIEYRYQRARKGLFFECGGYIMREIVKLYSYSSSRPNWYYANNFLPTINLGYSF